MSSPRTTRSPGASPGRNEVSTEPSMFKRTKLVTDIPARLENVPESSGLPSSWRATKATVSVLPKGDCKDGSTAPSDNNRATRLRGSPPRFVNVPVTHTVPLDAANPATEPAALNPLGGTNAPSNLPSGWSRARPGQAKPLTLENEPE